MNIPSHYRVTTDRSDITDILTESREDAINQADRLATQGVSAWVQDQWERQTIAQGTP